MELLTAAQMRAIETAAIASGAVTGLELMERAGQGVVDAILAEWPELAGRRRGALPPGEAAASLPPRYLGKDEGAGEPSRAVVLCGPGNNGGDGFVVARLLKEQGWEVEVFLYGDPDRLPPDARVNYARWCGMGVVASMADLARAVTPQRAVRLDLVVDAVFGTGLTRPLPEEVARAFWLHFMTYLEAPVVAVDVPSGLCADSGQVLVPQTKSADLWPALEGQVVEAQLTVSFHRAKRGHLLADGPRHCGRLRVVDIGLPDRVGAPLHDSVRLTVAAPETLVKRVHGHKYSHGHALILSGPPGRGGAARLAARGALRIGAGLVTLGCSPEAVAEHAARLDAVMVRPVADAEALARLLEDRRITALCLGPGMGTGEREAALVAAALGRAGNLPTDSDIGGQIAHPTSSVVLDADALTILSDRPALFAALHDRCVLTPHAGEFARLFPDIAERLDAPATRGPAFSKVDATREAAARAGCVVLFKGPDTVIANPGGCCVVNSAHYDRAAPWLATAGSGDVLAGFITGLLARGFDPRDAAATGAWLHVECARSFGPGLIAEDLPEELPKVFRALGL